MIKINGQEIKPTIFPDGTSQIWKVPLLDEPNLLTNLFKDGKLLKETSLSEIKQRLS